MTAILVCMGLLAGPAFAHGGEDHGPPPAPAAAVSDADSVATWSSEFEAVVRLPYDVPGAPIEGTLLLADYWTSAPIEKAEASISLTGAGTLQIDAAPSIRPGIFPLKTTFPADGAYSGGISVMTENRADILGLPEFERKAPEASGSGSGWGRALLVVAPFFTLLLGLVIGLGSGFGAGRWSRRAAAALLALALLPIGGKVLAHGGEDHGAPPPPKGAAGTGDGLRFPMESQFLLGFRTAPAREVDFEDRIRSLGTTVSRPGGSAELHSPVTGVLQFVNAELAPGQPVRAGDPLALITEALGGADLAGVIAAQTASKVQLAEAQKALVLAERDVEVARSLGGVLSDRERQDREEALRVARETVRQTEIAAGFGGGPSPTTTLRAPISGQISFVGANPGDVVAPGDVIFRIVHGAGLWVEARVPEALGANLLPGAPASVVADARPDQLVPAVVLDPGLEADPHTGTLRVTLAVENHVAWLRPGMTVTAEITSGVSRKALVVPDDAIVESSGELLVFVKKAPETFEARPVRTGARSEGRREVLMGLEPGERVVTVGTYSLRSLAGR